MIFLYFVLCFCIAILAILAIVYYGRRNYGILESCGIPVEQPSLFLGSDPYFHKNVRHLQDLKRYQKHGPIWGAYIGGTQYVFIAGPELIRKVLVSESEYFCNRRDMDLGSPVLTELIGFTKGERWRELRSIMCQLFTPTKIKTSGRIMSQCASEFVQHLKAQSFNGRVKIDCRKTLIPYLIDMVFRTTLGFQMKQSDGINLDNNEFVEAFKQYMGETTEYNWIYTLSLVLPFLSRFSPIMDNSHFHQIGNTLRSILNSLSELQANNWVFTDNQIVSSILGFWKKVISDKSCGFGEETVLAQIIDLFIGGYEAPAATLSHLLLYIAQNSEIQDRLQTEVDLAFMDTDGMVDHDESIQGSEFPYATACVKEALRLCPAIFGPQRICNKDWTSGSISIKKGTPIIIPTWAANRNPEVFPHPEHFHPDRFLPQNKAAMDPYAFTSFGHGPRKCIGITFACESMKIFLVHA